MIRMDVTADLDILKAIEEASRNPQVPTKTAYRRNVGRLKARILTKLKVKPGKPNYPLDWQSRKQKNYVLMKLRQENNLPYQRTDKLINSYDMELVDDTSGGAILQVTNSDPKACFVVGDDAQRMHMATGWVQIADVVSDARMEAENLLIDTWFTVFDNFAGVPQ